MSVAAAKSVLWWVETRWVGLDRPVGKVLAMQYRRRIAAATDRKVVVTAEEAYGFGSRQRGGERGREKEVGNSRRWCLEVASSSKLDCSDLATCGCG